jgi:signal peptidase II
MAKIQEATGPSFPSRLPIYKDMVLIQLAALVFLCDQFTKYLVREFLPFRFSFPRDGFLRFTHTHNTGSAFGIFQDQNTALIFASIVGIIVLLMIFRSQQHPRPLLRLSIGLQLGGAAGNLLDRFLLGHVTDFMDVGPWPVFNVADASIVTGLVMLGWLFLIQDRAGQTQHRQESTLAPIPRLGLQLPRCKVCAGEMLSLYGGRKCSSCGFKEMAQDNSGG